MTMLVANQELALLVKLAATHLAACGSFNQGVSSTFKGCLMQAGRGDVLMGMGCSHNSDPQEEVCVITVL